MKIEISAEKEGFWNALSDHWMIKKQFLLVFLCFDPDNPPIAKNSSVRSQLMIHDWIMSKDMARHGACRVLLKY